MSPACMEFEPDQIVAIGDDMNDIPMIREAGLGVAMGNARPEVKAVAKRVIGTNREEGLAISSMNWSQITSVEPYRRIATRSRKVAAHDDLRDVAKGFARLERPACMMHAGRFNSALERSISSPASSNNLRVTQLHPARRPR